MTSARTVRRFRILAGRLAAATVAAAGVVAAAQVPAGQPPSPPPSGSRQVVSERSPVRTDTTFAYRFRKSTSALEWSGGRAVVVATRLPADDREYARIAGLEPGALLLLERATAIKLTTDRALRFGAVTVPAGNVAPSYPGVYALWLRRTGDGWELVLNDQADSWGTQHDPAFDRTAVPLRHAHRPGETGELAAALEGTAEAAVLRIAWGEHEWAADFVVALEEADADEPRAVADTDWPWHGGDPGSSRYAALAQIDAVNVARLEPAWRWTSPDEAIRAQHPELRSLRHEAIPLAIGGRLFTVTSLSQLAAVDAATGETVWVHDPGSWRAGPPTNLGLVQRGAAFWRDRAGGEERLVYATGDGWLIAVDAGSGRPVESFGDGGRVDLVAGIPLAERPVPGHGRGNYTVSSPPLVVRDVVIVGSSIADRPTTVAMPRGDVRGFDVRSGKLLWTFHTVAQEGEPGVETWGRDSWRTAGNANVWTLMSGDEELGLAYLPTSTPTSDYYGGHRPGANLYAESLVAVEAATGRRRWHFQAVHHGLWDYDFPAAPILADVEVGGRTVRTVAQISKQGFTYVFDRATGEPVWPIEERPVPPSTVPGEAAWPTQPFPTRPPAFERQGSSADDLIDFTPELRAEALRILERYDHGPLYSPPTERGNLQLPGSAGGGNWGGAAFDPELGVLYVPSLTVPIVAKVAKGDPARTQLEWVGDREFGYGLRPALGPRGLPLFKPPYSRLTAIDLRRGEIRWQSPVGEGPRRQVEAITGADPGPLGSGSGLLHVLATSTLVLVTKPRGQSADDPAGVFAFDKASGRELARVPLEGEPGGSPITYLDRGRQYVVVATARDGVQALEALALPERTLTSTPGDAGASPTGAGAP